MDPLQCLMDDDMEGELEKVHTVKLTKVHMAPSVTKVR